MIQPPAGYSETWVFWGNPSSAQLCSQFDEETLEFIAVGSAFMLVLLKCSLLQGLVSKNFVFLDVKKTVFMQEAVVSVAVARYAHCHGCLRLSVNLPRCGLISRGP